MRQSIIKNLKALAANLIVVVILVLILRIEPIGGTELNPNYPRLANYFICGPDTHHPTPSQMDKLARYDLVILDMETQHTSPSTFFYLKAKNPRITILAYVSSQEIFTDLSNSAFKLRRALKQTIQNGWWLRNGQGEFVTFFPGARMLNPFTGWGAHLADFMNKEVISTGLWDGIFYDCVWSRVAWLNQGDVDIDLDGVKDDSAWLNGRWQQGMETLLLRSRAKGEPEKILIGNGISHYYKQLNGIYFENEFPVSCMGWKDSMGLYQSWMKQGVSPQICIINPGGSLADEKNHRKLRFGLTSALMDDGFFAYDGGAEYHKELWWYDEYSVDSEGVATTDAKCKGYLGKPKEETCKIVNGIWRRNFDNGIVLCNPTKSEKIIDLEKACRRIKGKQDKRVNDGSLVKKFILPAQDGIILLNTPHFIKKDVKNEDKIRK